MKMHMSLSVRGALRWNKADLKRNCKWITDDNGNRYTPEGLRDAMMNELAQGHEVIPLGECDNFDYKTGCKGHEEKEGAR